MNLKKKATKLVMVIVCTMAMGLPVFASMGTAKTVSVPAGSGWHGGYSSGPSAKKVNASQSFGVKVTALTMWSNPKVRLVNSNNESRTNELTVNSTGSFTGDGNWGSVNYTYYGQVKPAATQIGTDSITFSVDAN